MIALRGVTAGALANVPLFLGNYAPESGEAPIANISYPFGDARRYGVKSDGVNDDTGPLSDALAKAAGGVLVVAAPPPGAHVRVTAPITIPSNTVLVIEGDVRQHTSGASLFVGAGVTNSRILGRGGRLSGFSTVQNHANDNGVIALTAPVDVRIDGLHLPQCENYGISLTDAVRTKVRRLLIENFGYAAIIGLADVGNQGCQDVDVYDCVIRNCTAPASSCYGIAFGGASAAVNMDHRAIRVYRNLVDGVPLWNGLDTHGGRDQWWVGNIVRNVRRGIEAIIGFTNASTPHMDNINIWDNQFSAATVDVGGQPEFGINVGGSFDGATHYYGTNFTVRRNLVRGFNKFFGSGVLGGICYTNLQGFDIAENDCDDNAVNAIAGLLQSVTAVVKDGRVRHNRMRKQVATSGAYGFAVYPAGANGQFQNIEHSENRVTDYGHGGIAESVIANGRLVANDLTGAGAAIDGTPSNFGTMRENVGFVTRNYGFAAAAASPIVVNHGLALAPSRVNATPATNGAPAGGCFISGITATQFTITWAGGGLISWFWEAEV